MQRTFTKSLIVLIKEMVVITLNNVVLYGFQIICLMISHLMTKQYFLMGKPLSTIYNSNTNVSREILFFREIAYLFQKSKMVSTNQLRKLTDFTLTTQVLPIISASIFFRENKANWQRVASFLRGRRNFCSNGFYSLEDFCTGRPLTFWH